MENISTFDYNKGASVVLRPYCVNKKLVGLAKLGNTKCLPVVSTNHAETTKSIFFLNLTEFSPCQRAGGGLKDIKFTGGVWVFEGEILLCPPVERNL